MVMCYALIISHAHHMTILSVIDNRNWNE